MDGVSTESDMGVGLGMALSFVALVAALVIGGAGYVGAMETGGHGGDLQIVAGVALAVALLAGSLAIVAMHVYAD